MRRGGMSTVNHRLFSFNIEQREEGGEDQWQAETRTGVYVIASE